MLTPEMQKIINQQLCLIATVNKQGEPNIAPKGTMRVLNTEELVYAEIFGGTTLQNILDNPEAIMVVAVDRETKKLLRLRGKAEVIRGGELYEKITKQVEERKQGFPKPKAAIKIKITEVIS
ncbi:MAG: Pyridoxamine 5'-phosphate oxidase-related FMN-binding protein [Atribacteria bacterium 34_868]|nr:MAG: Pyridoxamine 5'-phosphate oxidase-related FMN-binding protein [Atribacteria bacterium 34_868]